MNTFKIPMIMTVIVFFSGLIIASIGKSHGDLLITNLGLIIIGMGLGIILVNGVPILFLDKNSTDKEWKKNETIK